MRRLTTKLQARTRTPDPDPEPPPIPPDFAPAFPPLYARCAPYTMTSVDRMYATWQAVQHVHRRGVPGDLVECGVWRGGSAMLMALTLMELGSEREIYLYDTFGGMTAPTERDADMNGRSVLEHYWPAMDRNHPLTCYASRAEVETNMARTGFEHVRYVEGPIEQTIPKTRPTEIAVLRLDTDWYESTRHELEHLWPLLSTGGVLIVDDYGHWAGARQAVDEFFANRHDAPLLGRTDYTGRMGVKQ